MWLCVYTGVRGPRILLTNMYVAVYVYRATYTPHQHACGRVCIQGHIYSSPTCMWPCVYTGPHILLTNMYVAVCVYRCEEATYTPHQHVCGRVCIQGHIYSSPTCMWPCVYTGVRGPHILLTNMYVAVCVYRREGPQYSSPGLETAALTWHMTIMTNRK